MLRTRFTRLVVRTTLYGCATGLAFFLGCAGGGGGVEPVGGGDGYPEWVRIVPVASEEASYFVGGCTSAASGEEGLACALEDALEQLDRDAEDEFRERFDKAHLDARAQTTSTERFRFRTDVSLAYTVRLRGVVETTGTYHRPCGDERGGGSVCDIFVLVTLGRESRRTAFMDVLSSFRKKFQEEGSTGLAAVAESMQRSLD